MALDRVPTMDEVVSASLAPRRFTMTLAVAFLLLAVAFGAC